jgi:hypothetical protein
MHLAFIATVLGLGVFLYLRLVFPGAFAFLATLARLSLVLGGGILLAGRLLAWRGQELRRWQGLLCLVFAVLALLAGVFSTVYLIRDRVVHGIILKEQADALEGIYD